MIGPWQAGGFAASLAFIASLIAVRLLTDYLLRRQILDRPNHRSSHKVPTPRGGGLGVTPVVVALWAALALLGLAAQGWWMVAMVGGAALLLLTSWWDDRHDLPPLPRLAIHIACVMASLAALPVDAFVFQGWLPWWLDRVVVMLGCVWFVNAYNFMDGIDGITGVETFTLGVGAAAVATIAGLSAGLVPLGLVCAGAALGFLVWNWHPARIFLGDSGSIPLGFLLSGLLVQLAIAGQLAAALILALYYLADATITLVRRVLRGEKVWQAHREHFYQRALISGRSHAQVSRAILVANVTLMGWAAVAAWGHDAVALAGAVTTVAALLAVLRRWASPAAV